jgi:hypothetical protein
MLLLAAVLLAVFALQAFSSGHVRSDLLLVTGVSTERAPQADYYQMWSVGALTVSHEDIYSDAARQELGRLIQAEAQVQGSSPREVWASNYWPVAQTTGTPFIYALLGIVQTGDFELDSTLFEIISLAALAGSLLWLCRRLGYGRARGLLLLGVVAATSEPLFMDLGWGNVNSLQVAMLTGYLVLRSGTPNSGRQIAAGVLLGIAILFKPNLALVVPLLALELILSRRWRDGAVQMGGLAIAGLVALIITEARFGSLAEWAGWIAALSSLGPHYIAAGYSVPATILMFLGYGTAHQAQAPVLSVLIIVIGLGATIAALVRGRAARGPVTLVAPVASVAPGSGDPDASNDSAEERRWGREAIIIGVAVAIMLIGSPFTWNHYFLLLTPLVVVLLRPQAGEIGGTRCVGFRQLAAASAVFLMSAAPAEVFGSQWDPVPYLVCLAGAAVILLVVALLELSARAGSQGRPAGAQRRARPVARPTSVGEATGSP